MFDPETGNIDLNVAKSWYRYDLSNYITDNWERIGSKLQGKIFIWVGTADAGYFNNAVRVFESNMSKLENPKSDAIIEFKANGTHCEMYSQRRILEQIAEKLDKMDKY